MTHSFLLLAKLIGLLAMILACGCLIAFTAITRPPRPPTVEESMEAVRRSQRRAEHD